MNDFHYLVIWGVADYAESHKKVDLHVYAMAAAAESGKELLTYMGSTVGRLSH
jgi:hypothetical protein